MAAWRTANPDRAKEQGRKSRELLKERQPDYHREWYKRNAESERERCKRVMRELRRTRPELERENKRKYRARNLETVRLKEREKTYARRAMQPYSPELAELMAELVTKPCTYCGATENITVDHIVPLSRGGRHEAENLAPACFSCNSSKSGRLLSEWEGKAA